jgi:hypothetical protein
MQALRASGGSGHVADRDISAPAVLQTYGALLRRHVRPRIGLHLMRFIAMQGQRLDTIKTFATDVTRKSLGLQAHWTQERIGPNGVVTIRREGGRGGHKGRQGPQAFGLLEH